LSQKLALMNFRGWETLVCKERAISPFFSSGVRYRVNHKLYTNVAVTGEPGIGKSYDACDMARICEGVKANGMDRFKIKQVVYRESEYLGLLPTLRMGKCIVFDEPSYALGKRDWFKEVQKVLVRTLESQRFLIHPLYVPIVNLALLDKTIRAYLISHVIHVVGRGHGICYRVKPSQRSEKVYWYNRGDIIYRMFDNNLCSRDSCLGCKKLGDLNYPRPGDCQIFRAQYERKKKSIQLVRYEQGKEQAEQMESKELTEQQIEQIIMPEIEALRNSMSGKLDVGKIRVFLRDQGIRLSVWKTYQIKRTIESANPKLFEQD
jgi:hypothetical protein